ncbi:hypothetical protein A9Q81_21355 [Gammaproteobacteria bacterium 42_54_T18]|nr:hypothetical protein A9Q81_21355 [Gammaproteobacteria bacterium 42_54_T18]
MVNSNDKRKSRSLRVKHNQNKGSNLEQPLSHRNPLALISTIHGALAVLIPTIIALTVGLLLWVLTLNKRKALNGMTYLLGWIGSIAAGLRLTIDGIEIIDNNRPAIFIFNHQSGIDPIILCRLLRKNIVGVAKIELKSHPVIGPLLSFGDTLFVDRDNKQSKTDVLDDANLVLSHTLSVAISPEGTRSKHSELGQFRSGPFRLARRSNRPIVPIIIVNSSNILPPRSLNMKPGLVHIKVLPPIYPEDWADNHPNEMAKTMHNTYMDELTRLNKNCS